MAGANSPSWQTVTEAWILLTASDGELCYSRRSRKLMGALGSAGSGVDGDPLAKVFRG